MEMAAKAQQEYEKYGWPSCARDNQTIKLRKLLSYESHRGLHRSSSLAISVK
jgi:hypothetical protein